MSDATKPLDPLAAARNADWQQVALNGGPPCFYLEDDNHFCLRAERWAGHDGSPHSFISLAMLLADREAKLREVEALRDEMRETRTSNAKGWVYAYLVADDLDAILTRPTTTTASEEP